MGEAEYTGVGPIHMESIRDQIAIADYVGGTAHIYGPIDPSTGVLGGMAVSTPKLSNRSLMHMVTSDPLCKDRRLLAVDADYPAVLVVDHRTGSLVGKVDTSDRIRYAHLTSTLPLHLHQSSGLPAAPAAPAAPSGPTSRPTAPSRPPACTPALAARNSRINFHPSLPVAYLMYEAAGSIGVWSWPRCEAWLDDAVWSPPAEVSRFSTMPSDPPLPPGLHPCTLCNLHALCPGKLCALAPPPPTPYAPLYTLL